jgi:hypothetical protein
VQRRAQVDVEDQVDVLGIGLEKRLGSIDAGIIDENVEIRLIGKPRHPRQVRHIEHMRDAACPLCQLRQRLRAAGERVHFQALAAQPLNHSCANSR